MWREGVATLTEVKTVPLIMIHATRIAIRIDDNESHSLLVCSLGRIHSYAKLNILFYSHHLQVNSHSQSYHVARTVSDHTNPLCDNTT